MSLDTTSKKDLPISQVAPALRQKIIEENGEAGLARILMQFDQAHESNVAQVLKTMQKGNDPRTFGLGVLWLDGKGYGQYSLAQMLSRKLS